MNQAASEMEKNVSEWARKRQAEREGITQIEINNKASRYGNKNGPETKKMNAWNEWKQRNRAKLNEHPYGYEEMFVNMVLMQIGEIQPADVISQYHFCDDSGKNRYIDFVIENKSKNWLLPIELDGYSKMQMGYEKFDDFLVRQNALIKRFSIVLRYSNNKFRDYPTLVIREIKETLILQQQGKIISRPAIERLNEEIEKLKQFLTKTKQESDKKIIKIIENHEKQIKIFEEKERKHQEKLREEQEKRIAAEHKQKEVERERQRVERERQEALQKQLAAETEWREATLIAMEAEQKYNEEKRRRELIEENLEDELYDRPSNNNKWLYAGCFLFAGISITAAIVYFFDRQPAPTLPRIAQNTNSDRMNTAPQQIAPQSVPVPAATISTPATATTTSTTSAPRPVAVQQQQPAPIRTASTQTAYVTQPTIDYIMPYDAKNYIGENRKVCGNIAEVKEFNKGFYLNFEDKYPNQPFTAVIWKSNKTLAHQSVQFSDEYICVSGKIEEYRKKPQIIIKSASQINP